MRRFTRILSAMTGNIETRHAGTRDRRAFAELDSAGGGDLARRTLIDAAIAARRCWVAEQVGQVVGYAVLTKNFFNRDFIELVHVVERARRCGVGSALLGAIEQAVRAGCIFTSTNESNAPMRALLERHGYMASGRIENLDPGDPELVFVKFLSAGGRKT
jgi:ribosomal protein S18 acetylase RimI-like enzyme